MEFSSSSSTSLGLADAIAGVWREDPPRFAIGWDELERVIPTLIWGRMGALVWKKAARTKTASGERARRVLHKAFLRQSITARLDQQRIVEVLELLAARKVPAILFKGWDCGRFYPPTLRPMGDIDLVVRERDLANARMAIAGSPAIEWIDLGPHRFAYRNSRDLEGLFERSQETVIGTTKVRVLSNEDRLRVLCTHMFSHQLAMPLWLCDIAAVIESLPIGFDWERCVPRHSLAARRMSGATALARDLLGARVDLVPEYLAGMRLPEWALAETVAKWTRAMRFRVPASLLPAAPVRRVPVALSARWPTTMRVQMLVETGAVPGRANLAVRHLGRFMKGAAIHLWRSLN